MGTHRPGRVLVIEDDRQISEMISEKLSDEGFLVDLAQDGPQGFELALKGACDAIILDLGLPGMDGIDLLERLRSQGVGTPVLILSGKDSVDDRVLGLQSGGDDYLVKPFALAELLARIQSLLRRAGESREASRLKISDLALDPFSRQAFRGTEQIELQPTEYSLLEYLMRNSGRAVTRAQILQHVWGYSFNPSTNLVDVHICRLREKIERPGRPRLLKTLRGVGYLLSEDDSSEQ